MSNISQTTASSIDALMTRVKGDMESSSCLEEAAQKCTNVIYEEFKDSIVLIRQFVTVPFGELPASNKTFVTQLAQSAGISSLVNDQTLVLSLVGTRGEDPTWNDRRNSRGHVGIPLASGDFVEAVPMISRMLKELGLGLDWIDTMDSKNMESTIGTFAGVFFVPDAKTSVDHKGRKIIAAQDFVMAHDVKTVFGVGGGYVASSMFATNIIFTRDNLTKKQAELFMQTVNVFKICTMKHVYEKRIFAQ